MDMWREIDHEKICIQHQSGAVATGQAGTVSTQESFKKDESGVGTGRNTTMTSSETGNQYQGSTTYNKETGIQHTGKCYDAQKNEIPCSNK